MTCHTEAGAMTPQAAAISICVNPRIFIAAVDLCGVHG
jgi:hypothetical protein